MITDNRKYRQKVPLNNSGQFRTRSSVQTRYDRNVPNLNHDPYRNKPDSVKYSGPQRGSLYSAGSQERVWLGSISLKLF